MIPVIANPKYLASRHFILGLNLLYRIILKHGKGAILKFHYLASVKREINFMSPSSVSALDFISIASTRKLS